MDDRFYFRQLLSGRDLATDDRLAQQMVNFIYLIGDRETGEAVVVDPAYDVATILDTLEADGMRLTGVLATHYHADHIGGSMMGFDIRGIREILERTSVPIHLQADEADYVVKTTGVSRLASEARSPTRVVGPSMPGIITSSMIASGRSASAFLIASAPEEAVSTSQSISSRQASATSRIMSSSSTIITRLGI